MIRLLQRVRAFDRRHPLLWDIALIVPILAISVNATPTLDVASISLLAIAHGAAFFRRRRPFPALVVVVAVALAGGLAALATGATPPWVYLVVWLLLFNSGLRTRGRTVVIAVFIVLVSLTGLSVDYGRELSPGWEQLRFALAMLAMSAASFLLGLQLRTRREQATRERAEIARTAAIAERSRIAQEMHDIIGHNLSVITSLATGGAVAARTSPRDAVQAFDAIGDVSRSSVREMRRVLTVLRQDYSAGGAPFSPQPGIEDIPALADSVRAAGLDVRLERSGDARPLSAGRQLAVYRIVQESLTNTLRHAGSRAHVNVTIAHDREGTVVVVHDNGSRTASNGNESAGGAGHGLIGMRERADTYGGTVDAGMTDSGWQVRAFIPRAPAREAGNAAEPSDA